MRVFLFGGNLNEVLKLSEGYETTAACKYLRSQILIKMFVLKQRI